MVEDNGHYRNDLHHHFELAEFAGFDSETFRSGDGTQAAHQELAADDDYGNPRGNQAGIQLHQRNEGGGDEKLVGQRIEQDSHGGDLTALASEVAVDSVGGRSGDEDCRCQQLSFAIDAVEARAQQDPHQQRNAGDADERDGVRQIHTTGMVPEADRNPD